MTLRPVALAFALLLTLGACRTADHPAKPTAMPPSAAISTSTSTSTSTTPPGTGPCSTNIRVIPGQVDAAAGHRFLVLTFNNVDTKKSCRMIGYPKVDLVENIGISGKEHVVGHARQTLRGQAGLPAGMKAPQPVVLAPGKSASAIVEASAIPQGNAPDCKEYSLKVTPPGQHSAVSAGPAQMPECDIQVHPVVAGDLRNQ